MNLLRNGDFSEPDDGLAVGWELFSPRDAIRPQACMAEAGVRLAGNGSPGVWEAMVQTVTDVTPGTAYRLEAMFAVDDQVECVHDAIDVIVIWQDAEENKLQNDFGWQLQPDGEGGCLRLSMTMVAPAQAASAAARLVFHWSAQGAVTWQRATLEEIPTPEPRLMTVSVLSNSGKMGPEVQTRTIDLGRSLKGSVSLGGCETWNDVWRAARRPQLYAPLTATIA